MLLEGVGLIDVWREQVFGKDKDKIQTCEIGTIDLSDHAPIHLLINLNLQAKIK